MSTQESPARIEISPWALPMHTEQDGNPSDVSKVSVSTKDASILLDAINRQQFPLYTPPEAPMIPTEGPATEPDGPRTYTYIPVSSTVAFTIPPAQCDNQQPPDPTSASTESASPSEPMPAETATADRSSHTPEASPSQGGVGANHYPSASGVPRLPPILQVEKQQVTTSATQVASANRRRNEAHFQCPVPGCGSTFTRRFNLRGHLRSHTEERPYVCSWPDCKKGFARQHDCKRHQALHSAKAQANVCTGCSKTFSRLDALNRHLRSDGGSDCRRIHEATLSEKKQVSAGVSADISPMPIAPPDVVMSAP